MFRERRLLRFQHCNARHLVVYQRTVQVGEYFAEAIDRCRSGGGAAPVYHCHMVCRHCSRSHRYAYPATERRALLLPPSTVCRPLICVRTETPFMRPRVFTTRYDRPVLLAGAHRSVSPEVEDNLHPLIDVAMIFCFFFHIVISFRLIRSMFDCLRS